MEAGLLRQVTVHHDAQRELSAARSCDLDVSALEQALEAGRADQPCSASRRRETAVESLYCLTAASTATWASAPAGSARSSRRSYPGLSATTRPPFVSSSRMRRNCSSKRTTMTTAIDQITPITHMTDAAEVATGANDDLIALLETLRGGDWQAPTECPAWNVSDMVGHVIGSAKAAASKRELLRQNLYGFRHAREYDGNAMDAYNALQVAEHAALTPAERVAALKALTARAVRGRIRTPAFLRAVSASVKSNGSMVEGMPNKGNFGHLREWSTPATCSCTASTSHAPWDASWPRGRTTAGSSRTPWASGRGATNSP